MRECIRRLAGEFHLSAEEREQLLPSGKQATFDNRVHWARTYMVQAAMLEPTKRGHVRASQRGLDILAKNPAKIDTDLLLGFEEFRAFRARRKSETDTPTNVETPVGPLRTSTSTPEELVAAAYTEITDQLRSTLLQRICEGTPEFFERLIIDLLIAMGYGGSRAEAGQRVGRSGDGGIDGIINEDRLGLDIVYLQAKRYAPGNVIGVEKVREFAGSLVERGASKGVFVTTSHFAAGAKTYVDRIPQRLVLIDGAELTKLMVRFGVGVRVDQTIEFKKLDLDYFEEGEVD